MTALDYYHILGVRPTSTLEEVRRRYRLLARRHHPDHNPDDPEAADRFRLVAEAFEAIQAARSKAKNRAGARSRPRRNASQYRQPRFSDQEQFFEEFFGISPEGSSRSRSAGSDFRYDLEIPFVAAIKGMGTVITVDHHPSCCHCGGTGLAPDTDYHQCPDCQGWGRRFRGPGLLRFGPVCERCQGLGKIIAVPCRRCDGRGFYSHKREYPLEIPAGTQDGACFRLKGEGGPGFHNGPPGNLLVMIHVAPHAFFTRMGNDIHCKIEVSWAEAAMGGAIRIPTLDGFQMVNLPQGTQSGWTFRFIGAGAPETPQHPQGDQVNEVIVAAPPNRGPQPRPGTLDRMQWGQLDRAGHE